jgi:hypothetical protein
MMPSNELQLAAALYLLHVHEGVTPANVKALSLLAAAGRLLQACGYDKMNPDQLRRLAEEGL